MNSYILKSLQEYKKNRGVCTRPAIRRPGKRKSTFIDHNDYVIEEKKQPSKQKKEES